MDNIDRSTPISQINTQNTSNDTVNNILQNFNELNDDKEEPVDETYEYDYATDKTVYAPDNPIQNTNNHETNNSKQITNNIISNNKQTSFIDKLIKFIQAPLIVFCILFIFNLQIFDKYFTFLIKKSASVHGDLTLLGLCLKSLIGAIIFYLFNNVIF